MFRVDQMSLIAGNIMYKVLIQNQTMKLFICIRFLNLCGYNLQTDIGRYESKNDNTKWEIKSRKGV